MNNLIEKKIEYLLSIPENFSKDDVVDPVDGWFKHFHKEALWGKSKPKFQFENYVCVFIKIINLNLLENHTQYI